MYVSCIVTARRAVVPLVLLFVCALVVTMLATMCSTPEPSPQAPAPVQDAPGDDEAIEPVGEPTEFTRPAIVVDTTSQRRHTSRAVEPASETAPEARAKGGSDVAGGASKDEPLLPEGVVPDDEKGSGDATVTLHLRDRATGLPVTMDVRLWRFDVSASDAFTAGDHVQVTVSVGEDGTTVAGLPAGRYRAEIEGQRHSAADPPEFRVETSAELILEVDPPRTFHAYLRVFDETGTELTSGTFRSSSFRTAGVYGKNAPEWAEGRRKIGAPHVSFGGGGAAGGRTTTTARHTASGLDLGPIEESTRARSTSREMLFLSPRGNAIECQISSDVDADVVFAAPSVDVARLVEHISLPDGRGLAGLDGMIEASCSPVVGHTPDSVAWRRVPIKVTVTLGGYRGVEFEWRVDDPPPAPITLQLAD